MTRKQTSDLFRWLVKEDRIGDWIGLKLAAEEIDDICSLIEGDSKHWQDEWREFQEATQPKFGIGTQPSLGG